MGTLGRWWDADPQMTSQNGILRVVGKTGVGRLPPILRSTPAVRNYGIIVLT